MFNLHIRARRDSVDFTLERIMATFVLKKYAEPDTNKPKEEEPPKEEKITKEMTVEVTGSVAEVVANALNRALVNKDVEIEEVKEGESEVNAISTEEINKDPVSSLRKVRNSKVLLIATEGFTTKKEEWFLQNIEGSVGKVFYTVESFVNYIVKEFSKDE